MSQPAAEGLSAIISQYLTRVDPAKVVLLRQMILVLAQPAAALSPMLLYRRVTVRYPPVAMS